MPLEWDKETLKIGDMFNQTAYELVKRLEFKSMFSRFEGSASTSKQAEQTYRFVADREGAKEVLAALKKGEVGYAFVYENEEGQGLALYQEQLGGVWMEASMAFLILEIFQPFFADSAYRKIGHDVKKDIRFLRSYGYDGFTAEFDTAIGAYILNATGSSYEYDDIAAAFLNETYPSQEEVFGKGRTKKAFAALPEAERTAYGARQAEIFFRARKVMEERLAENEQKSLFYDMEMPLIYVLADMEKYGIKVDKAALLAYQKRLGESLDGMEEEIYALAGEKFNINSPKQLGVILFEKLGLKGGKKTKTGYSTAADVLEKLRTAHPIVERILHYRQLAKLKSTYADGLLAVMDAETEKIYSTFNQTITATGRISSTEPNLQNIPVRLELGRELRKIFIPESAEFCFLDADYSQIELRVLAHISGDESLIAAFKSNQDIHRMTASQVFHVPFDEVTPLQRSNAKAVNFGIIYGKGAFSLGQDLGISRKEAEGYAGVMRSNLSAAQLQVAAPMLVYSGMLLPALNQAREKARRISCVNNVKQVMLGLTMYANDHDSRFPADNGAAGLNTLVKDDYLTDFTCYICPSATDDKGSGNLTEDTCSYIYLGGTDLAKEQAPSKLPVVFDKPGNHRKGVSVGFADGHVEQIDLPRYHSPEQVIDYLVQNRGLPEETGKVLKQKLQKWNAAQTE